MAEATVLPLTPQRTCPFCERHVLMHNNRKCPARLQARLGKNKWTIALHMVLRKEKA